MNTKTKLLNAAMLLLAGISVLCPVLRAEPVFSGKEANLEIKPSKANYYLAELTGESDYYDPMFYDDYIVSIDSKPVMQFTKVYGEVVDFYYYIDDSTDLIFLQGFFKEHKKEIDAYSPKLMPSLSVYMMTEPQYSEDGLHSRVGKIIEKTKNVSIDLIMSNKSLKNIDAALYRYLRSNGINSLGEIEKNAKLAETITNKFYMLATTCFYREWTKIKEIEKYIPALAERAKKNKKPFKACVFACSTGEEVLTYAVELADTGITDFTILASDINDSSLEYAKEMHYSYGSFSMLPLKTQQKLRKYFKLNAQNNTWEPVDPVFFKTRIKFINHDILSRLPLPVELGDRFSPPYDLVSILNVLVYLDSKAVQSKKGYWKDIIAPSGLLVLHDPMYSVMSEKFGTQWGFKNFIIVNDWVNIRADNGMSSRDKVKIYENNYNNDESEMNLRLLNFAYTNAGESRKANMLCASYLQKHPHSANVLNLELKNCIETDDKNYRGKRQMAEIMDTLASDYLSPDLALDNLIALEPDPSEVRYLRKLKETFGLFFSTYKDSPHKAEQLFDFQQPVSPKWNSYRIFSQIYVYTLLNELYKSDKAMSDYERLSLKGVDAVEELLKNTDKYLLAAKYLDSFLDGLSDYYNKKGLFDKTLELCNRGDKIYKEGFKKKADFYVLLGLGDICSYKVETFENRQNNIELINASTNALDYFEKAMPLVNDSDIYMVISINGKLGKTYFARGKARLAENDLMNAEADFRHSINYIEKAMEMTPVYSKYLVNTRQNILDISKKYGILKDILSELQ